MGQISRRARESILLTAVDRLVATNADGGLAVGASHVILFGEDAGQNLSLSNVIVLGAFALDAGIADTDLTGMIAIGVNAGSAITSGTGNDDTTSASVIMGHNAARVAVAMSGSVVIGAEALANFVGSASASGPERSVVIGNEAGDRLTGATQFTANTIIGWRVLRGAVGNTQSYNTNTLIGDQIARDAVGALTANTVVGSAAGVGMGSGGTLSQLNVIMGAGAANTLADGDSNTIIGQGADVGTPAPAADQESNVIIGRGAIAYGSKNVLIGTQATTAFFGTLNNRSIIIGHRAGITMPGSATDVFVVETFDGVNRTAIFGDLTKGVVVLGNSNYGVDRDTGGAGATNLVKILNGTVGAAPPVGGGFLFCTAGELLFQSAGASGIRKLTTPGVAFLGLGPPVAGGRDFINDGLAPAWGAPAAGGGAVFTPVYSDGVGWFFG